MTQISRTRLRQHALAFVLVIGVVSFFADFTYESARSINGPYLASLGASATIVGIVVGFGEFAGYSVRLFSGRLADATGLFWPITIVGYAIQMSAVPALALTNTWPEAAALIILERFGKAIRNPPRDVMLAQAGKEMSGYGWAFGLHEAMDQFGAMFGPLLVAYLLAHQNDYHHAFAVLVVPAVINLLLVAIARWRYPRPVPVAQPTTLPTTRALPRRFWVYLAGAMLAGAGFADYPLIAFHFSRTGVVSGQSIAIFYAVAMGVSGSGSLFLGRLFDRYGFSVLIALTLISTLFAPLVFWGQFWGALAGAAVWGLGMGVHESLIPAAVSPMVPEERRASAFGLFTAGYGLAWFAGSALIGVLYDHSVGAAATFCIVAELAAVPLLVAVAKLLRQQTKANDEPRR